MGYATVKKLDELKDLSKDYVKYSIKKDRLKRKYSENVFPYHVDSSTPKKPATDIERKQYRKYLKELGDLLFKPKGNYQKFCWKHLISSTEQRKMEMRAKGVRANHRVIEF